MGEILGLADGQVNEMKRAIWFANLAAHPERLARSKLSFA
jgi:hypothetical protein